MREQGQVVQMQGQLLILLKILIVCSLRTVCINFDILKILHVNIYFDYWVFVAPVESVHKASVFVLA